MPTPCRTGVTHAFPTFPKLDRDIDVDVVVVGGGFTGLTTAYLLAASGRSVAVLERDRCAQVDTGHTTAHLTMVTDRRLKDLERAFGRTHAQAVWDAGLAAIAQVDDIVREHGIDCAFEWVDGYLHAPRRRQPAASRSRSFRTKPTWRRRWALTRPSSRTCRSLVVQAFASRIRRDFIRANIWRDLRPRRARRVCASSSIATSKSSPRSHSA